MYDLTYPLPLRHHSIRYPLWMRGGILDNPAMGSVQNHSERPWESFYEERHIQWERSVMPITFYAWSTNNPCDVQVINARRMREVDLNCP